MSKVAVIGSNSFSGADFVDLLLEDHENDVIGISRSAEKSALFLPYKRHQNPKYKFHHLNLNEDSKQIIEVLDSFRPDYIVNFAAQSEVAPSWENPEHWFQTNVVALSKLANHLRTVDYLKRYVHISSPEVYGTCTGTVTESAPFNPSTPYAASKAAADMFLQTLFKNFQFPVVFIRATNVYGAHQQLWKIIPRAVINMKSGRKIHLHGGGKAVKSYIHIRDVSEGEKLAMLQGKPGSIYHFSPDKGESVRDVVKLIAGLVECDFDKAVLNVEERLGQDAAYVIDSTLARQELLWKPKRAFKDGLLEVVNWINKNWNEIAQEPLEYVHKA
ncbi:MAG: GDP-mannose 4,6-dehydratase [Candidatus Obscuribacterales bacterium]|nr:GDP-mannose 4,6-dehydratase [Candidatus Obscuribacterales bacterium]